MTMGQQYNRLTPQRLTQYHPYGSAYADIDIVNGKEE